MTVRSHGKIKTILLGLLVLQELYIVVIRNVINFSRSTYDVEKRNADYNSILFLNGTAMVTLVSRRPSTGRNTEWKNLKTYLCIKTFLIGIPVDCER